MSIEKRVFDVVSMQLGVDVEKITYKSLLVKDLGADSLDLVELVMELEEEFSEGNFELHISDGEADKLKSVGEIIDYISKKISQTESVCDDFT
jgi:acyl carrier protein